MRNARTKTSRRRARHTGLIYRASYEGPPFLAGGRVVVISKRGARGAASVHAFAKLTEVLARLDAEGLELVVADVDGSPDFYELPEFKGKVHGAGETAWLREGKIVATSGLGLNIACFEPNTLALLAMP